MTDRQDIRWARKYQTIAFSATLGTILFPETAGIRDTLEFDAAASCQIGVLGIRLPAGHTFTTLPALAKVTADQPRFPGSVPMPPVPVIELRTLGLALDRAHLHLLATRAGSVPAHLE